MPKTDADVDRLLRNAYVTQPGDLERIERAKRNEGRWGRFRFQPVDLSAAFRPVEWLIDDFLEAGALAVLYGPSNSMKTFLALSIGLAIARNKKFFGRNIWQSDVLYIGGEGERGIARRIIAWYIANKVPEELRTRIPFTHSTITGKVTDPEWIDRAVDLLLCDPVKPGLIIFDTLSKTFGLEKEDNESISRALAILQRELVDRFRSTVLIVHHTGKDATRGARGGSSLEADCDAMYETRVVRPVKKADEEGEEESEQRRFDYRRDRIRVTCRKMKDAEVPPDLLLGGRLVEIGKDEVGRPITSLTLVPNLSDEDAQLLSLRKTGMSIRLIAEQLGLSKTSVGRRLSILDAIS